VGRASLRAGVGLAVVAAAIVLRRWAASRTNGEDGWLDVFAIAGFAIVFVVLVSAVMFAPLITRPFRRINRRVHSSDEAG
jgi:hypothetical protein